METTKQDFDWLYFLTIQPEQINDELLKEAVKAADNWGIANRKHGMNGGFHKGPSDQILFNTSKYFYAELKYTVYLKSLLPVNEEWVKRSLAYAGYLFAMCKYRESQLVMGMPVMPFNTYNEQTIYIIKSQNI
jgi:hypothetical protein